MTPFENPPLCPPKKGIVKGKGRVEKCYWGQNLNIFVTYEPMQNFRTQGQCGHSAQTACAFELQFQPV